MVLVFYQNNLCFPSILQDTFSALYFNTGLTQPLSQRCVRFYKFTGTWMFWKYSKMTLILISVPRRKTFYTNPATAADAAELKKNPSTRA